jgi:hypothetical protein
VVHQLLIVGRVSSSTQATLNCTYPNMILEQRCFDFDLRKTRYSFFLRLASHALLKNCYSFRASSVLLHKGSKYKLNITHFPEKNE